MKKYKVLKDFVLNGVKHKLGSIIELDYKNAHLSSIQDCIELYVEGSVASSAPAPKVEETANKKPMSKYKVLRAYEDAEGTMHEVGTEVELTDEQFAALPEGTVEAVTEATV